MAIVDQLDYLWVKFSHAMVVPIVQYGYRRQVGLFAGKIFTCYGSSISIP